jgi:hypothetical protein
LRKGFLEGITQSPQARQFAFRFLALLATNQAGKKAKTLSFLQSDLTAILAGNTSTSDDLATITSLESIQEWVCRQFPSFSEQPDYTRYLNEEHHLWTLYQVIRVSSDIPRFIAAITTYGMCLGDLTSAAAGRKKHQPGESLPFSNVTISLLKRIPTKPLALNPLLEFLRLCCAWASVSNELQEELSSAKSRNHRLKEELEKEQVLLAAESVARQAAESRVQTLTLELAKANESIASLEQSLKIQAGAHEAAKQGAVATAVANIRQTCLPGLENIHLYADRSEPNTPAIIRKAQELSTFLTNYPNS